MEDSTTTEHLGAIVHRDFVREGIHHPVSGRHDLLSADRKLIYLFQSKRQFRFEILRSRVRVMHATYTRENAALLCSLLEM